MASGSVTHTPRSSVTAIEPPAKALSPLDEELERDEREIHEYGGDDPHPPPAKPHAGEPYVATPPPVRDPQAVTWDGPDDPANPMNWSVRRKWFMTAVCVFATVCVTFASSAPSSALLVLERDFHTSAEVSYLTTTTFLLGYVFGPLVWGPGSELFGRKRTLAVAMVVFTLFHLGQALAHNLQTFFVTRFLAGFFGCAPLVSSGGVLADIWSAETRGVATSIFSASVFIGPVMGPIVAGYIVESGVSWRWIFWVGMIFSGTCTALLLVALRETYVPVLMFNKVKALRKADPEGSAHLYAEIEKQDWTPWAVVQRTLFRPFTMLAGEPILVLVTLYLSLVYGVMYCRKSVRGVPHHLRRPPPLHDRPGRADVHRDRNRHVARRRGQLPLLPALSAPDQGVARIPPAEERLLGAMIGSPAFVVGAFWLGWTGQYASVPWYVPELGAIVLGMGISLIFMSFLSYLVDTYLMYAASAFAANTFMRSLVAAVFPLFTVQMFNKLGVHWASTLLGGVGLLLMPSPFLFYKYGARIREKSKFAPCLDLKIARAMREEEAAAKGEKSTV
ncbi:unnamed protein product [Mycena citricolor]|uniref:Major facilitator superfamily (MFS) profile domain-containing protein n=1 Tax=Mycena citricolor TaxID=2018698 RepID=A0AAD2HM66_9AGAR|nr:unnamed protein product [Mycena citricolor]